MGKFNIGNNSILIGPKYTTGEFANSFAEMKIDSKISGLKMKIENLNNFEFNFSYNEFYAKGEKAYLTGEAPLSEEIKIKEAFLSFGKIDYKTPIKTTYTWKISGSYYSENQIGNVTSSNPILIFITGGNSHKNTKKVKRTTMKIEKTLAKNFLFETYYKIEIIKGQIYTNNPLFERSNSLGVNFTYSF